MNALFQIYLLTFLGFSEEKLQEIVHYLNCVYRFALKRYQAKLSPVFRKSPSIPTDLEKELNNHLPIIGSQSYFDSTFCNDLRRFISLYYNHNDARQDHDDNE